MWWSHPVAVRTACAEELGHPVDWDNPASYQGDLEGEYEAPSERWTVGVSWRASAAWGRPLCSSPSG